MGEEECEFDEQSRFFFDHDPTFFHQILNFMRSGECTIPYGRGDFEAFRADVQYWRLDTLEARCDIHYTKHIQPQLAGERGLGAAAKRKGPNGKLVHSKYVQAQRELNGAGVERVAEAVHAALLEGAAHGLNRLLLTAYRPPETIGVSGLPLFRSPDWPGANTLFCWDQALIGFFQPASGMPALDAARDYLVARLEELGFKTAPNFDPGHGYSYDISSTSGDE